MPAPLTLVGDFCLVKHLEFHLLQSFLRAYASRCDNRKMDAFRSSSGVIHRLSIAGAEQQKQLEEYNIRNCVRGAFNA